MRPGIALQGAFVITLIMMGGCAAVPESLVRQPEVSLSRVECTGLGFNSQTFVLSFNVHNPNSFALPVEAVSYGVKLDGKRFATGETSGRFTVPARGSSRFAIDVDLNLLSTSPELLATVREGVRGDIDYELYGRFDVDLPAVETVKYRKAGTVQLDGSTASFLFQ